MCIPDIITNKPSTIELLIFEDEEIHLPFHIQCIPSENYSITVKRFKNNKQVKQYNVSNYYINNFNELLKNEGIVIQNNKWKII